MRKLALAIVLSAVTMSVCAQAAHAIALPDPETIIDGVPVSSQHMDFYSYSLPILGFFSEPADNFTFNPGNPFYVATGGGHISDLVVIGTGSNGNGVTTNFAGMDNAFETPGANNIATFQTQVSNEPGQVAAFAGDNAGTWDTTLNALVNYLNGNDLVFLFNHNETGGEADIYAWGKVSIVSASNPNLVPIDFYFADVAGIPPAITDPSALPAQYVAGPSDITIPTAWGPQTLVHNLGRNQAAYALFSPALNAGISEWMTQGYDAMQCDFRLAGLNGGYEQLIIDNKTTVSVIPEPASLMLLGAGLAVVAGLRKKRYAKTA